MHYIAASIMCADQLNLQEELKKLEEANVELLHCDVMDGVFVHNLAMGPYVLEQIKESTEIPLDIHLATVNPSKFIDMFAYLKPEYISFHVEVSESVEKDIGKIRNYGIKPALAISPETPLEKIEPFLSDVEMILLMTVNPGFAGQKFNYSVLRKLEKLHQLLEPLENRPLIEVDGNINADTIPPLVEYGANIYVLGTSALFNSQKESYREKVEKIKKLWS